jgi:hypothetical protein
MNAKVTSATQPSRSRRAALATTAVAVAKLMVWPAITLGASSARAELIVLDDSGSYTDPPHLTMQWRTLGQGGSAAVMEGRARLALRLDTRAHAGRLARIYMVMSPLAGAGLTLTWQTRGRLLGGRIASGERVLVFRGVVPGPTLEDELALFFSAESQWGGDLGRVQCRYELELER